VPPPAVVLVPPPAVVLVPPRLALGIISARFVVAKAGQAVGIAGSVVGIGSPASGVRRWWASYHRRLLAGRAGATGDRSLVSHGRTS